ncbi:MAG: asparagine synthase (glutamine-hydrolyzing) [Alphaproteobacteria bacterium]|jgi:asparagine synthase (glutamine-hydrolysing)|nr:asparagine synthase (glutamine-hydrolyzing) [Alphaproteobacteria bacterium]
MCGIAGFWSLAGIEGETALQRVANAMGLAVAHRGPDGDGVWVDPEIGIGLAHRRLAIIDLKETGHQPMSSTTGRYVISYNGEIYNYPELRLELEKSGVAFRGTSDTEVLLALVERYGLAPALKRTNGMFAFALWDRETQSLSLARDRYGQKPLYYALLPGGFAFGSELSALRAHPDFVAEIDRDALVMYLRFGNVPAPHAIFRKTHKLVAGTTLTIDIKTLKTGQVTTPQPYWSAEQIARDGLATPFTGTADDAVDELDRLLGAAVERCMVSDVPLGAFLSGGLDSSAIVALMQARSSNPIRTFSIGFHEAQYNEAKYAAAVAAHLGTAHTELYVTPEDVQGVIPKIPEIYDEPFADSSQIPTFLVSQLARESVTVSLSGDAGDEQFVGYNRYAWGNRIGGIVETLPGPVRKLATGMMRAAPPQVWDKIYNTTLGRHGTKDRQVQVGHKIHKLAELLRAPDRHALYLELLSQWNDPGALVTGAAEPRSYGGASTDWPNLDDFTQEMLLLDTTGYLPNDILVKFDRAAMAVGLEGRVPFLDHTIGAFAWSLPLSMKLRDGATKWPVRKLLERYVPRELIERPKMGFGVPIGRWLRTDLRDWAEALLSTDSLGRDDLLNPVPIRKAWDEHLSGRRNWEHRLWAVLMFQAWREHAGV